MRIMYLRAGWHFPEMHAGTELTMHWLLRRLADNGHQVAAVALGQGLDDRRAPVDRKCGYPVVRCSPRNIVLVGALMAERFEPDVLVLTQLRPWLGRLLSRIAPLPLVLYEHVISAPAYSAPDEARAGVRYVANSEATARHLEATYGVDSTIVPPLFGIERYADVHRRGDKVLFVNLQLRKGADVALAIARRRPDVSFIACESWEDRSATIEPHREEARRLGHVMLTPNQPGLEELFVQTRLLLMPSRSQEAWGRTASEAQLCGIPVLGSSRGNLPRTIGEGGVTLDPDEPIERWLEAFDRIIGDEAVYADLSAKAKANGRLMLQQVEQAYRTFEEVLKGAVAAGP